MCDQEACQMLAAMGFVTCGCSSVPLERTPIQFEAYGGDFLCGTRRVFQRLAVKIGEKDSYPSMDEWIFNNLRRHSYTEVFYDDGSQEKFNAREFVDLAFASGLIEKATHGAAVERTLRG